VSDLLNPKAICKLTEEQWGGSYPISWDPIKKGISVDRAVKNTFGGEGGRFDPFDMNFFVGNISHHEIKTTTTNWIKLSPKEKELADSLLQQKLDMLYWIYFQHQARDDFQFKCIVRWSKLTQNDLIFTSQYDMCNVEREGVWTVEPGYCFSLSRALSTAEPN